MAGLLDIMNELGEGLAYNTPESKKKRDDDAELVMWEKKQQLANKMAIDLEARKLELSRQFPEVKQLFNTNLGVVLSRNNDGTVSEVWRDEDARASILANKTAPMVNAETRAAETPSKIAAHQARAGLLNAQTEVVPEDAETRRLAAEAAQLRASNTEQPKALTPTQTATLLEKARKAAIAEMAGPSEKVKAIFFNKLSPDEQKARIAKHMESYNAEAPTSDAPASSYGVFGKHVPQQ